MSSSSLELKLKHPIHVLKTNHLQKAIPLCLAANQYRKMIKYEKKQRKENVNALVHTWSNLKFMKAAKLRIYNMHLAVDMKLLKK